MTPFEITWEAPEFEERDRDVSWYWISIIIAAVFIAFAVLEKNFLFGLFIVVAEILLIVWAGREARMITFTLSDKGITINHLKHYHLNELQTFSINEVVDDPWEDIMFHFKGKLRLPLSIKAPQEKIADIRKNLRPAIKEITYEVSFIDSLEKMIGF